MHSAIPLVAALLLAGPALAQGPRAPVPERPPIGQPDTRVPERQVAPMDRSGRDPAMPGVMRPGVNPDPGMSMMPPLPVPGAGRVIPPPGTPGGDPTVQPR